MQRRVATTVLAVVGARPGEELRTLAASLGQAANVRAVLPAADLPPLDRAVAAWGEAVRAHIPYVVHDADPLADVAAAWVDRWDGTGDVGRLEVAAQAVLQRWRAGALDLPDYYLLVDAESLPPTTRHWYLGVLGGIAPHRVTLAGTAPGDPARAVRRLRSGRWWPQLDVLLVDLDRRVPDASPVGEPPAGTVV